MTTNQMRYFVTVCENMSFTKAAEALYITQPAISKHISALEKELGIKLIDRTNKGKVSLTSAGEYYLGAFRESLTAIDGAGLRARRMDPREKHRYCIGIVENWSLHMLMKQCREVFESERPDVQLDFIFLPHKQLNSGRMDKELDFVLTIGDAFTEISGYTTTLVSQIHPTLLISARHPLAQKPDLSIRDLKDELYYTLPDTEMPSPRNRTVIFILDGGVPHWIDLPNLSSIAANVLSGSGYTSFDEWSNEAHNPMFRAALVDEIKLSVIASWRQDRDMDIGERLFRIIHGWAESPVF